MLYSSLTVAGALSCLLVFPLRFLYSMGVGGALVALSRGGRLADRAAGRARRARPADQRARARAACSAAPRARAAQTEQGAWFRLARGVMRRPGLVALVTGAALLAVALPSLRLALAPADAHVLPSSSQPRQVAEALTRDFPVDGSQTITMVVRAARRAALRLSQRSRAARRKRPAPRRASGPPRYLGRGTWEIELLPRGTDGAPANQRLVVRRLRTLAGPLDAARRRPDGLVRRPEGGDRRAHCRSRS